MLSSKSTHIRCVKRLDAMVIPKWNYATWATVFINLGRSNHLRKLNVFEGLLFVVDDP